ATESANALYPVMRHFSFYSYEEDEDNKDGKPFDEAFNDRKYDYCEAETGVLAEYSGLSRQAVYDGLESLKDIPTGACLIARDNDRWKVFIHPPKIFKRDFLNRQARNGNKAK
ncbi:MAG: hypothetical protein PHC61_11915, partial [Chitinivibrionales bacterium]|nr:hypothetical protein [Chitinivibrionales bacterium]